MRVSDKTANIGVAIVLIVFWSVAIGAIYELYQGVKDRQCTEWQTKPLDQVDSICLQRFIK